MTNKTIGLRVRPWTLKENYLTRTLDNEVPDLWAIEKCSLRTYDDGKSYLEWKSIYDFESKEIAQVEADKLHLELPSFNQLGAEPPQSGDLVLMQAQGHMSGALGLIEGNYGSFKSELDVIFNPEEFWVSESKGRKLMSGTNGVAFKIDKALLMDCKEVICHDFKHGYPSEHKKSERFLVRLYVLTAGNLSASLRRTA